MHLSDPSVRFMGSSAIVGNSIPVGVGIGYGIKLRQEAAKSIIFFGDGATEEGIYYESLNFSIIHRLPTVFICENNYYSVYSNLDERQPRNLMPYQLALSMGMNAYHVGFGDLTGTFEAFESAMSPNLREPVFLQIDTYRWLEHCGPNRDDDLGYRPNQEIDSYLKYDTIKEIANHILSIDSKLRDSIFLIEEEAKVEVSNAFEYARKSSFPSKDNCIGDFHAF